MPEVFAKYFRHRRLSSFQRQLNYFGFRHSAPGTYMHPSFLKHDQKSAFQISRKRKVTKQESEAGARRHVHITQNADYNPKRRCTEDEQALRPQPGPAQPPTFAMPVVEDIVLAPIPNYLWQQQQEGAEAQGALDTVQHTRPPIVNQSHQPGATLSSGVPVQTVDMRIWRLQFQEQPTSKDFQEMREEANQTNEFKQESSQQSMLVDFEQGLADFGEGALSF